MSLAGTDFLAGKDAFACPDRAIREDRVARADSPAGFQMSPTVNPAARFDALSGADVLIAGNVESCTQALRAGDRAVNDEISASERIAREIGRIVAVQVATRMKIAAATQRAVGVHTPANAHVASDEHTSLGTKMSRDTNVAPDVHCSSGTYAPFGPDRPADAQHVAHFDVATHLDRTCIDKGVGIDAVDDEDSVCRTELVHQPAGIVGAAVCNQFVEQFLVISAFSVMAKEPAEAVSTGLFARRKSRVRFMLQIRAAAGVPDDFSGLWRGLCDAPG